MEINSALHCAYIQMAQERHLLFVLTNFITVVL